MKICIQAGHKGVLTGATGASGERDWTTRVVSLLADNLRGTGVEVYETGALADTDEKVTGTDWDLFLAVHYDADIYNDRGGFCDYPDESTDQVYERSKYLSDKIEQVFFGKTGIPVHDERSNANTKFYYMWSALSAKTPCVLIECGVGNRKPEDYEILRNYELIVDSLTEAIHVALGIKDAKDIKIESLEKELDEMRTSRNSWRSKYKTLEEKYENEYKDWVAHRDILLLEVDELKRKEEVLQKAVTENKTPLSYYSIKERLVSILDSLVHGGDLA